eukprot:GEMP01133301.1.p1 GENE.GEMP01133301.1~~GEMP01133301.1.p1  ORF type:complete len:134 (-),score=3.80 GEMP01133301.1:46-447(-)
MFCHPQGVYGTAQDTHTTPSHFPAISCIFCVLFRVINRFPVFRLRPCYDFSLDFFRLFWFFGFRTRHGPLLRHPRHRHPGSDWNAIGAQIAALPANGFFWFRSFVKPGNNNPPGCHNRKSVARLEKCSKISAS